MSTVLDLQMNLMFVVYLVLLGVKVFAFVNSLLWSAEHYTAAGKLTKPAWTIILGLGVLVQALIPGIINFLNLIFTIAAFVYLADVRPALAGLTRRR